MKTISIFLGLAIFASNAFAQSNCFTRVYNETVSKQNSLYFNNDSQAIEVAESVCSRSINYSDYTATRQTNIYNMGFNTHEQALEVAKLVSQTQIRLEDYMAVRQHYLSGGTLTHEQAIQNALKSLKYK